MNIKSLMFCLLLTVLLYTVGCSPAGGENTGHEYMPDMGHSIAYESNYYDYYNFNTWGTEEDYHKMAQPRSSVAGTVARGYAGIPAGASASKGQQVMNVLAGKDQPNSITVPVNGSVPYHYANTDDERTRATTEIVNNPFPIRDKGLAVGKELYTINCGICHGDKGDGNGWLVDEANINAKYPAQPANLINEEFTAASNGRYYHAIMHGKGVMGGYADKLSYEERWQVIHYVRSLQAKETKLTYSEEENTLNTIDIPGSTITVVTSNDMGSDHSTDEVHGGTGHGDGHGHDENHGDDHSHDDHGSGDHH